MEKVRFFRVKDYVTVTDNFQIRFISDSIRNGLYLDGGSLVEALMIFICMINHKHYLT